MILAFPVWRRGFLKVVGSVITEALARQHRVLLIWREEQKIGEGVDLLEVLHRWPGARGVEYHCRAPNVPLWDAIIGDPSVGEITGLSDRHRYALDFAWEQRMRRDIPGTTRCWATGYQRALFGSPHAPIVGMTALDALTAVTPERVRGDYNLEDRPIVLLFSLKFGGVPHLWRQTIFRHVHYTRLMIALKAYCRRYGMRLVVKTRTKNNDPLIVRRLANHVIADGDLWPYTSARLIRVAHLVIHFQSGAVFEAAAAGVPQLSIRIPQPHVRHFPGYEMVFTRWGPGIQSWPGVVQSADYRDAVDMLGTDRVMSVVNVGEREVYAARYLGPLDGKNAARVLDMVEARHE